MLHDASLVFAFVHLSAILLLTVFLSARTALTRVELLGGDAAPAVVARLRRLDAWTAIGLLSVAGSGAMLVLVGAKGSAWYLGNPLLWGKLALFVPLAAMAWPAARGRARWSALLAGGAAITAAEVGAQRRWLMWQAHLMVLLPLLGLGLARGY